MTFPTADFKTLYPTFAGEDNDMVGIIAGQAVLYMPSGCKKVYNQLWMLLTAHLLQLRNDQLSNSAKTGVVTGASIGGVSVSFATPPANTSQKAWFSTTPYGLQFLALRKRCVGLPRYVGGRGGSRVWR